MEYLKQLVDSLNAWIWGMPMLAFIMAVGAFLMIELRALPILKTAYGFRLLWSGRKSHGDGDITPFNALMTSLSATIGTGNIAGVATAITLGGPGALFWMWCAGLFGMATKYAEVVCAVKYREKDSKGNYVGGPMYYIKNGLGPKWGWLATAFAFFGVIAGFGIGNAVQSNSVADVMETSYAIPTWVTGVILMVLIGSVIVGGIRSVAKTAGRLIPLMALLYVGAGLFFLILNIDGIPDAFVLIFEQAFSPTAATGGFAGATVWAAIQFGIARGIFSNEAGLGSAPIAHASAMTNNPARQGTIAMLGTFIDTLIICSITGLVIVVSGAWTTEATGASLTSVAFSGTLPNAGQYIVSIGLALFAFTTILGWSVYGERCASYLFGIKSIIPFRVIFVLVLPVGAIGGKEYLEVIWLFADMLNALMALPNLIALVLLSPVVVSLTREWFSEEQKS